MVEGYETKGEYKEVGGLKTCMFLVQSFQHQLTHTDVTGSPDSKKAIVDVYDVFGLASQTLQGADAVAAAIGCLVLVPDFLQGEVAKEEWFAPGLSPELEKERNAFFGILGLEENVKKLTEFVEVAKGEWKGVESWGTFGLCWGGKVSFLFFVFFDLC